MRAPGEPPDTQGKGPRAGFEGKIQASGPKGREGCWSPRGAGRSRCPRLAPRAGRGQRGDDGKPALGEDTSPALPGCAESRRWQLPGEKRLPARPAPGPALPARLCPLPAADVPAAQTPRCVSACAEACALGGGGSPGGQPQAGMETGMPNGPAPRRATVLLAQVCQVSRTSYAPRGLAQPGCPGARGAPTPSLLRPRL